ncbi:cytochrome-c peroxidase [Methylicorpusculum oleiharenae]|uniref:cytochrome-c peroxidase n=1 Tax=Methylicorpusculum oleiharenae TaxID=1338687 RepID=UPI001358140F|nr:cytochrome c peroxidase [Methylicorpusculum oleiharenae]MCD2453032.1 cytochrome-c peroxidase [Methylicorpusculum oleiharenae]
MRKCFIPILITCILCACSDQPESPSVLKLSPSGNPLLGLPPLAIPENNPQTPEKSALGKQLFQDKRFSADDSVNCARCHVPANAFIDSLPVAAGIKDQFGTRNSPSVINAAFYTHQFWDGRRDSLEEQAKDPFVNVIEHGLSDHRKIVDIVRTDPDYIKQFRQVFGLEPAQISIDQVVMAIAGFERTLIAGDSPFDQYRFGGDSHALNDAAIRGLAVFQGKGRCTSCHKIAETSALFTDNQFHNLGIGFGKIAGKLTGLIKATRQTEGKIDAPVLTNAELSELGRYAVTGNKADLGHFKTPTLRNIVLTAPYMHDGSLANLAEVIEFHNQGGFANPFLDTEMRPLGLTQQEKSDLAAFMEALTSSQFADANYFKQR